MDWKKDEKRKKEDAGREWQNVEGGKKIKKEKNL